MQTVIYKICSSDEWAYACHTGIFEGSADDIRDGFIHFSSASQLKVTAAKHFAGMQDLIVVAVDSGHLGNALKWEVSRSGELFPHLYDMLPVSAATKFAPLFLNDEGKHIFPEFIKTA